MSIPPDPPSNQPTQPRSPSRQDRLTGAIAAAGAVFLITVILVKVLAAVTGYPEDMVADDALVVAPVASLAGVILGSFLTIFEPVRQFAIGFLITSAILIFATAGACTVQALA